MDLPRNIIVIGHTDNIPIKNYRYEYNWDLSVIRSVNFMKLLSKIMSWIPKCSVLKDMGNSSRLLLMKRKKEEGKTGELKS